VIANIRTTPEGEETPDGEPGDSAEVTDSET
jgi:hypothetical protein